MRSAISDSHDSLMMRATARLVTVSLLGGLTACGSPSVEQAPQAPERIAVIVAHPDDETALGGVLARYAREAEVHLVVAADGRYGVTAHAGIPEGDSLAVVRSEEARCSAERLGLASVHMLGAHDGLGMRDGTPDYFRQMRRLRDDLRQLLESLSPELIVTFGPDGDTGHADHRIISALVTEFRLQGVPSTFPDLLYLAWTKEQASLWEELGLGHVDETYIDTVVRFTVKDEEKSFESIRCYRSQLSPEEIDRWIRTEHDDTTNLRYFRTFNPDL